MWNAETKIDILYRALSQPDKKRNNKGIQQKQSDAVFNYMQVMQAMKLQDQVMGVE